MTRDAQGCSATPVGGTPPPPLSRAFGRGFARDARSGGERSPAPHSPAHPTCCLLPRWKEIAGAITACSTKPLRSVQASPPLREFPYLISCVARTLARLKPEQNADLLLPAPSTPLSMAFSPSPTRRHPATPTAPRRPSGVARRFQDALSEGDVEAIRRLKQEDSLDLLRATGGSPLAVAIRQACNMPLLLACADGDEALVMRSLKAYLVSSLETVRLSSHFGPGGEETAMVAAATRLLRHGRRLPALQPMQKQKLKNLFYSHMLGLYSEAATREAFSACGNLNLPELCAARIGTFLFSASHQGDPENML